MSHPGGPSYHPVPSESHDEPDRQIELHEQRNGRFNLQDSRPRSSGFLRLSFERRRFLLYLPLGLLGLVILVVLVNARNVSKTKWIAAAGPDGLDGLLGPNVEREDGFTIMVPTYKRPEMLPDFLDSYATGTITSLRRIVILWHDDTTEPPRSFVDSIPSYPVPVVIEHRDISLNERFRMSKNIATNCVLAIDDDMRFEAEDVEMGYQSWKEFGQGRKRMLGYVARDVVDGRYLTHSHKYSIVLTKSAFFHTDWMNAYWSTDKQMTALRGFVDEHRNCEDILMSFLHARYTRLPPLYLKVPHGDVGVENGISTQPGHMDTRTACVQYFLNVFGEDTLVSTTAVITRMGQKFPAPVRDVAPVAPNPG